MICPAHDPDEFGKKCLTSLYSSDSEDASLYLMMGIPDRKYSMTFSLDLGAAMMALGTSLSPGGETQWVY